MLEIDFRKSQTQLIFVLAIIIGLIGFMFQKLNTVEQTTGGTTGQLADNPGRPQVPDPVDSMGGHEDTAPADATLTLTDTDHIRGDADADIIIYEYSDYECPFCAQNHPVIQALVDKYDGKVAWVYKHFPLSIHANAQKKAEAAECVAELGGNDAFWSFTDDLFEAGTQTPVSQLASIATDAGVDASDFQSCLDSGRHTDTVTADLNQGLSVGVQGTPGNVIVHVADGTQQLIPGALPQNQFESVIDGILQ